MLKLEEIPIQIAHWLLIRYYLVINSYSFKYIENVKNRLSLAASDNTNTDATVNNYYEK